MLNFLTRTLKDWGELKKFQSIDSSWHRLVIYSEGGHDWPHLRHVIEALVKDPNLKITYLSSAENDPGLSYSSENFRTFLIGSGSARTAFFKSAKVGLLAMTMPDLGTFHIKRSVYPVHYLYIFHSINSTQMVYRKGAFDNFDTILSVGPHHDAEIRQTEALYSLKPKSIIPHGYGRLDELYNASATIRELYRPSVSDSKKIVLAPSWGTGSFIEDSKIASPLLNNLIEAGHQLSLRLHPMTVRRMPRLVDSLTETYSKSNHFNLIKDMNDKRSLEEADIMISDWSGAAFEFAYAYERPLIFLDTPPKVNNPEWERISLIPLEKQIRNELGVVLTLDKVSQANDFVQDISQRQAEYKERILSSRKKWVYNLGHSGESGAKEIQKILNSIYREKSLSI